MLTYGVNFFLLKPGFALLALGLMFLVPLSFGPFSIGSAGFSLNTMLLAMAVATLGLSMVFSGVIAGVLFDYSDTLQARIESALPFSRTFIGCLLAALAGLSSCCPWCTAISSIISRYRKAASTPIGRSWGFGWSAPPSRPSSLSPRSAHSGLSFHGVRGRGPARLSSPSSGAATLRTAGNDRRATDWRVRVPSAPHAASGCHAPPFAVPWLDRAGLPDNGADRPEYCIRN